MNLLPSKLLRLAYTLAIATLSLYIFVEPARAQEEIAGGIAENVAAGKSPTDFHSRVRIRTGYLNSDGNTWLIPTRLSATYAPRPDLALRVQVPVFYRDPESGGGDAEFGTSDISARALLRVWNRPGFSVFAGLEFFFPTESDPTLGTEKYAAAPILAALVQLTDNLFFIPVYQQIISFAGEDDRAEFNILRFRPLLVANWPHGIYTMLDPGFLWDLEDEVPIKDTMTLGLQVGKAMNERVTLSAKPAFQVYGTEDFSWIFELGATYRFQ